MTPNGLARHITVDDAHLDVLERDLRTFLADARSGGQVKDFIAEVVTDSDFVPTDEQAAVALEMYERIVEADE